MGAHFLKYKNFFSGCIFVYFFELGLKSGPGSCIIATSVCCIPVETND